MCFAVLIISIKSQATSLGCQRCALHMTVQQREHPFSPVSRANVNRLDPPDAGASPVTPLLGNLMLGEIDNTQLDNLVKLGVYIGYHNTFMTADHPSNEELNSPCIGQLPLHQLRPQRTWPPQLLDRSL